MVSRGSSFYFLWISVPIHARVPVGTTLLIKPEGEFEQPQNSPVGGRSA
mgnify:FL=1